MQALLDALSQGRARARGRKWFVAVAAVAALGASAALFQHHDRAERVAAGGQRAGHPGLIAGTTPRKHHDAPRPGDLVTGGERPSGCTDGRWK